MLTGGLNDDDGRDKGLLVVIEPRDAENRVIDAPAEVSVAVLDPAVTDREGYATRVARWDFTAGEIAQMFRRTSAGPAIHIEAAWPDGRPPTASSTCSCATPPPTAGNWKPTSQSKSPPAKSRPAKSTPQPAPDAATATLSRRSAWHRIAGSYVAQPPSAVQRVSHNLQPQMEKASGRSSGGRREVPRRPKPSRSAASQCDHLRQSRSYNEPCRIRQGSNNWLCGLVMFPKFSERPHCLRKRFLRFPTPNTMKRSLSNPRILLLSLVAVVLCVSVVWACTERPHVEVGFGAIGGTVAVHQREVKNVEVISVRFREELKKRLTSSQLMIALRAKDLHAPSFFPEETQVSVRDITPPGLDVILYAADLTAALRDCLRDQTFYSQSWSASDLISLSCISFLTASCWATVPGLSGTNDRTPTCV